jgi:nucleotide-binding universal stress UspA family protein
MSALGTVIVGFDGTPSARDALALGARIAEADGAALVATFVYRDDPLELGDDTAYEGWVQEVARRELEAARALAPQAELVPYGARGVARGLHALAAERSAGLVVVGGTHRCPVGRLVPGSTAQRVLDGSPCPVAVAPRGWGSRGGTEAVGTIVVGVDDQPEGLAAARWGCRLAAALGASVRLVAVNEPLPAPPPAAPPLTPANPDLLADAFRRAAEARAGLLRRRLDEVAEAAPEGVAVETALEDGRPADRLVAHGRTPGAMLVVGSRGYGPIGAIIMGSVAAEVLREAHCPVVVVPRRA